MPFTSHGRIRAVVSGVHQLNVQFMNAGELRRDTPQMTINRAETPGAPALAERRLLATICALAAGFLTLPATSFASQLITRDATNVSLAVNGNGQALVTYRQGGKTLHVLAWGALNARTPSPSERQYAFKLDYSGGWGSQHRLVWRGFTNACRPYDGPPLNWIVATCKAQDGSYWALQRWQRNLPDVGLTPTTAAARAWDLRLSHWDGELPKLNISLDWSYSEHYIHLFGSFIYAGSGVYGFHSTSSGNPLDTFGRNLYLDTYDSAYGPGWRRENSFLTHGTGGTFCYGFYPHQNGTSRPSGEGTRYRATIIGPGVTPDAYWQGPAPGPYNQALDQQALDLQRVLFVHDSACKPL
jgi:hypothetical protein